VSNQTNRIRSQVNALLSAFEYTRQEFETNLPIDNCLTRYFRKHKFLGSRDRKLISNSIFGYYRWYGWLKTIHLDSIEKSLLLGYLLDNNQINKTIEFWISEAFNHLNFPLPFSDQPELALKEKLEFFQQFDSETQLNQLIPECTPIWMQDKLAYLQKRPPLWLRSIHLDRMVW